MDTEIDMESTFAQGRRNGRLAERAWKQAVTLWLTTVVLIIADLAVQAIDLWDLSERVRGGGTRLVFAPQNLPLRGDGIAIVLLAAGVVLPALLFRRYLARALADLAKSARSAWLAPYRTMLQKPELALDLRVATHATGYLPRLAAGLVLRSCPAAVGTWLWLAAPSPTWSSRISLTFNAIALTAAALVCIGFAAPTRRRVFGHG
jgi:hypothetical protein